MENLQSTQIEHKIGSVEPRQSKLYANSGKSQHNKLYMNSGKAIFGNKYATLSVSVSDPIDTRKKPYIDISFKCGKYSTHLFANSISEYEQAIANIAEVCDKLIDRNRKLEAAFERAWEIYRGSSTDGDNLIV